MAGAKISFHSDIEMKIASCKNNHNCKNMLVDTWHTLCQ